MAFSAARGSGLKTSGIFFSRESALQYRVFVRQYIFADRVRRAAQRAGGEIFQTHHAVGDVSAVLHLLGGRGRIHLQYVQF